MTVNEWDGPGERGVPAKEGVPRILVVDDEQSILTFAQRVLSDAGYEVAVALNGREALELVDKQIHSTCS